MACGFDGCFVSESIFHPDGSVSAGLYSFGMGPCGIDGGFIPGGFVDRPQ